MKKLNLLAIVALLFVGLSFSSCSKAECVTCSAVDFMGIELMPEIEYCDDMDYEGDDPNNPGTMITYTYAEMVALAEAVGSTCE